MWRLVSIILMKFNFHNSKATNFLFGKMLVLLWVLVANLCTSLIAVKTCDPYLSSVIDLNLHNNENEISTPFLYLKFSTLNTFLPDSLEDIPFTVNPMKETVVTGVRAVLILKALAFPKSASFHFARDVERIAFEDTSSLMISLKNGRKFFYTLKSIAKMEHCGHKLISSLSSLNPAILANVLTRYGKWIEPKLSKIEKPFYPSSSLLQKPGVKIVTGPPNADTPPILIKELANGRIQLKYQIEKSSSKAKGPFQYQEIVPGTKSNSKGQTFTYILETRPKPETQNHLYDPNDEFEHLFSLVSIIWNEGKMMYIPTTKSVFFPSVDFVLQNLDGNFEFDAIYNPSR